MANAGKDDNASQFFFTFSATPELQNKHTIFGKVTGETIYNMLKLEDAMVDGTERPSYPQKIIKCEILLNPFDDIVPRVTAAASAASNKDIDDDDKSKKKKHKKTGIKNFKLLSFGEEAEEDEEESVVLNKQFGTKGKSAHDNLSDPKLSSVLAIEPSGPPSKKIKRQDKKGEEEEEEESSDGEILLQTEEERQCAKKTSKDIKQRIMDKLQMKKNSKSMTAAADVDDEETVEEEYYFGKDRDDEKKKKVEAIQKEIRDLKKGLKSEKKAREDDERKKTETKEKSNDIKNKYIKTKEEFMEAKSQLPKKGASREDFTQQMLMKFRNKLKSVKNKNDDGLVSSSSSSSSNEKNKEKEKDEDEDDEFWMRNTLHSDELQQPVLAKDASTKNDDWFEIYDPRNPLNKRRRGDNKNSDKSKLSKANRRPL